MTGESDCPQPGGDAPDSGVVRRRAIFYVSGFDPQGPAHYYRLFTEQAALQVQRTAYQLSVGPRAADGHLGSIWPVQYTDSQGASVQSEYHFLRWDDIVRQHWPRGRWKLALLTASTSLRILCNGSWWSMCRASRIAGLTLALPSALGLGAIALAALGFGTAAAWVLSPPHGIGPALAYATGLAAVSMALSLLPRLWRRVQGDWLMRSTASLLKVAKGQAPEVEARISAWSDLIAAAMANPKFDEVLVVAHSSGCMGAVSALSRALRVMNPEPGSAPCIGLLTLGQCIPVLSHQPEAQQFRTELLHVCAHKAVEWIDVSAPPDACCFALTDPAKSPYQQPPFNAPSPVKRLSPKYAEQMTPESYQAIKKDKLRCHFQYLMAFDSPAHYDFFRWVCGPQSLKAATQHHKGITNFTRFSWCDLPPSSRTNLK